MKNITHVSGFARTSTLAVLGLITSLGLASQVLAYAPITTTLDFGETNSDVSNLQTFFKDNSAIYPEGLVTGYFGGLTRTAVQQFQTSQNIVSGGSAATTGYGRVGPSTRDAINALINGGGWGTSNSSDVSGPAIYNLSKSTGSNAVTFTWTTDELASAKVFYNTSPVMMNEGNINSVGFGSTNGWTSTNDMLARQSQQVTVGGLSPNTTYYYVIVATDLSGNVSVWNPNTTFRTNP